MPKYRWRTEVADYRKNDDAGLTFLRQDGFTYDFLISYSKNNTISSCLWTCRVYHFPLPTVWMCIGYPFHHHQHQQHGSLDVQGVFIFTASSTDVQVDPFPLPTVWTCRAYTFPQTSVMDLQLQGVSLSTANRMDVQGVTIFTARNMDVQCAECMHTTANSMDLQDVPLF